MTHSNRGGRRTTKNHHGAKRSERGTVFVRPSVCLPACLPGYLTAHPPSFFSASSSCPLRRLAGVVHGPHAPLHPLVAADLVVPPRPAGADAAVQHGAALVHVEAEEEGHADALPLSLLGGGGGGGALAAAAAAVVDGPVHRRHVDVVGDALQVVGDVDHERPRDRRRVEPLALAREHLQPRDGVLVQDREELEVCVRAYRDLFLLLLLLLL